MAQIKALQEVVTVGNRPYPIYIGFSSAADLVKIAEAPAFTDMTTHEQIATNILTPPIKDWQRPLDQHRVQRIADIYSNQSELMPNPVLLSENALLNTVGYSITAQTVHGQNTGMFIIDIPDPAPNHPKPLWILDGQHRINGLAQSSQAANHIPLVLLLNNQGHYFAPSQLAKIFAQVTTEARKLDVLHDAWLTYAFNLDIYHNNPARHNSMTTVADLCKLPHIVAGDPSNPFVNRIRFNPRTEGQSPPPGGFRYDCVEFAALIYDHYYNCASPAGPHLAPDALARQIVLAHHALTQVTQAPQDRTVFFSDDKTYEEKIIQDAWFAGMFDRLLSSGIPTSWTALFRQLNFHTTDWNFSSWVQSLGGKAFGRSRTLAIRVFQEMFRNGTPPTPSPDLSNYLQGDSATLELVISQVNANGRPIRTGRVPHELPVSGSRSLPVSQNMFVRLRPKTTNISYITVFDGTVKQGVPQEYASKLKHGVLIDPNVLTRPWKLTITSTHYGEVTNQLTLTINW